MKKAPANEGKSVYQHEIEYTEVEPCDEFYETFSDEEILDIIQNLESSRAVNMKYIYYGIGAKQWNEYVNDVHSVSAEEELMEHAFDLIVKHINKLNFDKVNFIDIGFGNAAPIKKFIKKLSKKGILNKYIGLDISKEMFKYAEKNLREVISKKDIVMHQCDIERDNIYSAVYKGKLNSKQKVCNIVSELGGTIGSHENVFTILENIHHSMDKNDLFFISDKILKKQNILESSHLFTPEAKFMVTWILQYMGIDTDLADLSYHYDEEKKIRYMLISLLEDYAIDFKVLGKNRKVFLPKGRQIRIWNHTPFEYSQIFEWCKKAGFSLASINTIPDRTWALIGFSLDIEDE